MAVNVLYDVAADMATLYCTTSDWAFGPVFYGPDADEKAIRFRDWFTTGAALERAVVVDARPIGVLGADGTDPRHYGERELERLYSEWRDLFCDDSDVLKPDVVEAVTS